MIFAKGVQLQNLKKGSSFRVRTKCRGIGWTKMIMSKKGKNKNWKNSWNLLDGLEQLEDFCEEKTVDREAEEERQELSIFTPPDDEEDDIAEDSSRLATAKKLSASEWAKILQNRNDFAVWNGRLHIYIEKFGYWRQVKSTNDNREIRQLFEPEERHFINKHMLGEVVQWLLLDAPQMPTERGESRFYLNLCDCAVDWRRKKREPIYDRKRLYFRYYINLGSYDLNRTGTGKFQNFLNDVFGTHEKTKREFCKFLGLCLSDIRDLKIAAFLYGPSNTGKSVMLNLLKKLVGSEFTASVSFSQLGNEFAISRLVGKRLNVSGEVSGTTNKRLDIFKSLTGNDEIEVCNKYEDFAA